MALRGHFYCCEKHFIVFKSNLTKTGDTKNG
ncbi:hypothetical protein [Klebsiella phage vB_KpnS-VAC2]|uniref:Uncharacterized protein n=1 Tax=Klebsiella phage vB_KpnS-VAC2 TaxID=2864369 RepID=A0AAE8BYX1_9CAUD|nr:hypothetical protein [Klebsiella phage vB_KpnS-VAC2]